MVSCVKILKTIFNNNKYAQQKLFLLCIFLTILGFLSSYLGANKTILFLSLIELMKITKLKAYYLMVRTVYLFIYLFIWLNYLFWAHPPKIIVNPIVVSSFICNKVAVYLFVL